MAGFLAQPPCQGSPQELIVGFRSPLPQPSVRQEGSEKVKQSPLLNFF